MDMQNHIFLNVIMSSEKIFKKIKPKYLISSHNAAVYYGSLINAAIRNNAKVITLTLEGNALKFLQRCFFKGTSTRRRSICS